MKNTLLYIAIVACAGALLFSCSKGGDKRAQDEAERHNIVETGTLAAINVQSFVLPRYHRYWWEMRIIGILEHGTEVQAGDSIIQIDPKDVNKQIVDRELELETAEADLKKMEVDQQVARNAAQLDMQTQQASFDLAKISLESSAFESDRFLKIKQLEFKQAEINMAMAKRKRELQDTIDACNLRIQRVRVERIRNDINSFKNIIPQLTIRTPVSGVFQVGRNPRTRIMLVVGDMASPSFSMGNVPELTHMKVEAFINELDFLKIRTGQKVAIRLDALPSVVFDGRVAYIGKLCHPKDNNSREKVFDVEVSIDKYDERLKPGMTVSCEFLEN